MGEKIGFIGAGNMGLALLKGYCDSSFAVKSNIYVFDLDKQKKKILEEFSVNIPDNAREVVRKCKYVFLMVKPQHLNELLEEVADYITDDTVFVSVCAGITIEYIRTKTQKNVKVILAMPNTPMLLGHGATAVATDDLTDTDEFEYVRGIIESCSVTEIVPVNKMKEIICINASSPAFIYLFAQGFMEYAEENGIEFYTAQKLFAHTLSGTAKMITSSEKTICELIEQVSSKGGTTVAGLEKLREGDFINTVKNACSACTKRAYELEKGV